ncbi:MAG: MBL fold metallo-hydrolase [Pseudomonadota bacterium]
MDKLTRRNFIRGMSAGTVAGYFATTGVASTVFKKALTPEKTFAKTDIGECKSVMVKCISETSWFNNKVQMGDFKKAGGGLVSQYDVKFTTSGVPDGYKGNNSGGYSSLLDIEFLDGSHKKVLLDTGWNTEWMDLRFEQEGVDKMLKNREIDLFFVSHDHYDHFWGMESVFKHWSDIPMTIPNSFMKQTYELIAGGSFSNPPISNAAPYKGDIIKHEIGKIYQIYPGVVSVAFGIPCGRGVFGEQVLIFNLKDKGLATVSGCCHMGLITLMEYMKQHIKGSDLIYGVYGGLHVSPYDDWDPMNDDLVLNIPKYKVKRIGCNHCTGYITVEKMIKAGIPVIKGTGKNLTKRDIYLGNGDTIVL